MPRACIVSTADLEGILLHSAFICMLVTVITKDCRLIVVWAGCRLAEGTRKAVEGWGLKLLCKEKRWNSDSLTVIETPQVGLVCNLPLSQLPSSAAASWNQQHHIGV